MARTITNNKGHEDNMQDNEINNNNRVMETIILMIPISHL